MSTNNNRLGKEVKPVFRDEKCETSQIKKFSGLKFQTLLTNELSMCTAVTLASRGIIKIEDFEGVGGNLRRLDLSHNGISRLSGMENLSNLSMLNVSSNKLKGDASLEDLRYLGQLRTLNISDNDEIASIRTHIVKHLSCLQALVASNCGFEKVPFIRFLPNLDSLILSKNKISEFSIATLGTFNNLKKISLGHNGMLTFPDLSSCPNLHEVRLNHNMIALIPDLASTLRKLKVLDVSHNLIADWAEVATLSRCPNLTNLGLRGNPLPPPPAACEDMKIREDVAGDKMIMPEQEAERRYRRYTLSFFQRLVGKDEKPLVQLVVLDSKRVKVKWTHVAESELSPSEPSQGVGLHIPAGPNGDGRKTLTGHGEKKAAAAGGAAGSFGDRTGVSPSSSDLLPVPGTKKRKKDIEGAKMEAVIGNETKVGGVGGGDGGRGVARIKEGEDELSKKVTKEKRKKRKLKRVPNHDEVFDDDDGDEGKGKGHKGVTKHDTGAVVGRGHIKATKGATHEWIALHRGENEGEGEHEEEKEGVQEGDDNRGGVGRVGGTRATVAAPVVSILAADTWSMLGTIGTGGSSAW